MTKVTMTVNGKAASGEVEGRTLLVDFLRQGLGLTGTHVGCDTSQCGCCVVHVDGRSVKSCTMLAVRRWQLGDDDRGPGRADGRCILQAAFRASRPAMRLCTPGMIMSADDLLQHNGEPDRA